MERHRTAGLGRRPPHLRAGREGRHPQGDRGGVQCHPAVPARPRGRFRRPHRQHRHQAQGETAQSAATRAARQIYFGVREHAMGSAMVGMAAARRHPPGRRHVLRVPRLHAPAGPAGRAVADAKVCFVFTHDSVGVGEDGPTHQPVEQLATLRAIPGLHVIRPADANETAQAWRDAVEHDGPTALVLSRQNIEVVTDGSAVALGAGVVRDDTGASADVVLVGTGSEVAVCVDAAEHRRARASPPGSSACRPGTASSSRTTHQTRLPAGVPVLAVEAACHLRLAPLRRRRRSASTASAPARRATRARQARHQPRPRRRAGRSRSLGAPKG